MADLNELKQLVCKGKSKMVPEAVQAALDDGATASELLNAMIEAMDEVGDKFSKGEIFVPEMLVASKAMNKGLEIVNPLLAGDGSASLGKCIIGTVKGDLHDIGKNLVCTMIGAAGFDMIDLGVDVPTEKFVETIKENPDVKVVALSALLTTTMPSMQETAAELNKIKGDYSFKLLVGGAPITQAFADEIGADGYALDAGAAGVKAKELVK